jgi:hypothetical protein
LTFCHWENPVLNNIKLQIITKNIFFMIVSICNLKVMKFRNAFYKKTVHNGIFAYLMLKGI